jgi:hypothetical protein
MFITKLKNMWNISDRLDGYINKQNTELNDIKTRLTSVEGSIISLESQLNDIKTRLTSVEESIISLESQVQQLKSSSNIDTKLITSDLPSVILRGVDEGENGIHVDLDWNDTFITKLRKEGYTGIDDEEIVQKWLGLLVKQIIEQEKGQKTNEHE